MRSILKTNFLYNFRQLDNQLDEDNKLQSATIFDGLRVVSTLYQHSQTPIFFRRIICLRSRRKFHSNGWHYIKKMMVSTALITVSILLNT